MTQRILVPLDQSPVAEAALPVARGLARQLGARVTLLTTLEVPSSFGAYVRSTNGGHAARQLVGGFPSEATPQSPYGRWSGWSGSEPSARQVEAVAEETAKAERYLRGIAETFEVDHVETVVQLGHPAERILQTAESRDRAIIVLASHGRSGIGRALVGSIASRVVQAATSPIFVVRGKKEAPDGAAYPNIRNVLVPVDGSTFAERTIPIVGDLFVRDEPSIHILQVIESPRYANKAQAQEYTEWLADQATKSGVPATWEVTEGSVDAQINEVAAKLDVDLIAMSRHGHTGIDRFVIGSVAERVLHSAEKPLLLIPARG